MVDTVKPIIALTTDFGVGSPYLAQMKGVLLSAIPDATLVDVAHELPAYDLRAAELLLRSTAFAFPTGAVHLVVVDPGVGSERRGIAVQVRGCFFVGPDNGVLGALATHPDARVVSLDVRALHRTPTAPTFHGRDIFAPAAAELAGGLTLDDVGTRITDPVPSTLPRPREQGGVIHGETLGADRYGNLTTNILAKHLGSVTVAGKQLRTLRTYAEAGPGELFALAGSDGYVELARREASAAAELGARGTPVICKA